MKQNIKIVGDVGLGNTKEVSLKEKLLAETQTNVNQEKSLIIHDAQQEMRPIKRQTDKNIELNDIELLSEIKTGGTVDMRNPLEVVSVGDGTVILVDKKLNYLQRINTEGEVLRKYQLSLSQEAYYESASVYGNCLFVLTDSVITKVSLDGSACNIKCKPRGVGEIDYISAIGDNDILITEGFFPGRISEYNTETNQVIQRVTDVGYPGKVSVVQAGHHTKYIVKGVHVSTSGSIWGVKIYSRAWNLISTIGNDPDVLTVTPGGKLLLVYNNRILEYSQNGTFIKRLLDKYKFNKIRDISCDGGYLWVWERNPCCIKIFVAN